MARPSSYTSELAIEICNKVSSCSTGLKKLCKEIQHWPSHETIYRWLSQHKAFNDLYATAKRDQVKALVDEIIEIADDTSQDDINKENGTIGCNTEWLARSRLRVDTRKWIAAKLVPRLYGDSAGMRELFEEIAELKKELEAKGATTNGNTNIREAKEDPKE